ncbi:MAG: TVP38/TMEM64 family protein [Clostridia bacterium]|nr:TVP38/TMEM64 family protein [Clostridia bacterium]
MERKSVFRRVIFAVIAVVVLIITVAFCVLMYQLKNTDNLTAFETHIKEIGIVGVIVMMAIQITQVIIPIIPGEPLELAMGAVYGTVWGSVMSLFGIAVGSAVVFLCVRRFGKNFVDNFIASEKFARLRFLHSPEKRDILLFLLMFIPGTPKDLLTFFAPFTAITYVRFAIISLIARIPSVVSSAYIGANLMDGNWLLSVVSFGVVGLISLAGIIIYNKIVAVKNTHGLKEEKK